jgi:outer membrane protein assembly factor BamE (lipoprotein component of BamABCDE complex)
MVMARPILRYNHQIHHSRLGYRFMTSASSLNTQLQAGQSKSLTKMRGPWHMRIISFAVLSAVSLAISGCANSPSTETELTHGYVLDERLLEQIKTGSSAEQVLVVMGTPSTTSTVGGDAWYYISQKSVQTMKFMGEDVVDQRVVAIYFDKKKKVERVANYGLQDGKIFDFVSRTTPTGGTNQSFVQGLFKNLLRF